MVSVGDHFTGIESGKLTLSLNSGFTRISPLECHPEGDPPPRRWEIALTSTVDRWRGFNLGGRGILTRQAPDGDLEANF